MPQEIARRHAFQGELVHGPDIIAVAHATSWEVLQVARAFFMVGERVGLDWLEHRLESLPVGTHWQRWAAQSMEDDLFLVRRQLVEKVIAEAPELIVDEAVEAFFVRRAEAEDRLQRFIRNLSVGGVTDLAQFTVACGRSGRCWDSHPRSPVAPQWNDLQRDPVEAVDVDDPDAAATEPRRRAGSGGCPCDRSHASRIPRRPRPLARSSPNTEPPSLRTRSPRFGVWEIVPLRAMRLECRSATPDNRWCIDNVASPWWSRTRFTRSSIRRASSCSEGRGTTCEAARTEGATNDTPMSASSTMLTEREARVRGVVMTT